jgi:peptidyl-prolyl cis-trans isomerase A (cyclophilin A)
MILHRPDAFRRRLLGSLAILGLSALPLAAPRAQAPTRVAIVTSAGEIDVQLDAQRAPRTVANFLQYVKEDFYAGTVFHRVIPGFMIQGGGFTTQLVEKKTHDPIALESRNGLRNLRGTIAMARTNDPDSATSQFFINLVDNAGLDYPQPDGHGYAVFGQVTKGLDIVDRIAHVATHDVGPYQDVPQEPVVIKQIKLIP